MDIEYEQLDYAGTLAKLGELRGSDVLLEVRVGSISGPFRLAARGVLTGSPNGQAALSDRRAPGDDLEAFTLDSGGFFTVKESDFAEAGWHAGVLAGQPSEQPRLNIVFGDSVLHLAVVAAATTG
jgi:hypothetical protein